MPNEQPTSKQSATLVDLLLNLKDSLMPHQFEIVKQAAERLSDEPSAPSSDELAALKSFYRETVEIDGAESEYMRLTKWAIDTIEGLWWFVQQRTAEPPSVDHADAERYRWLRSHIAPSIGARILGPQQTMVNVNQPEKLDELIDGRLSLTKSEPQA